MLTLRPLESLVEFPEVIQAALPIPDSTTTQTVTSSTTTRTLTTYTTTSQTTETAAPWLLRAAWAAWAAWLTPATPQLSSRWTPQKLRPQRPQRLQRPQWPQRPRTLRRAGHHWVGCGQPLRPPTAGGPSSWCRSSFRAKTRWWTNAFSTNVDKNYQKLNVLTKWNAVQRFHTQHFHYFGPDLHRLLHRSCNSRNRTEDEWWATRKVKGIHCSRKPHL